MRAVLVDVAAIAVVVLACSGSASTLDGHEPGVGLLEGLVGCKNTLKRRLAFGSQSSRTREPLVFG